MRLRGWRLAALLALGAGLQGALLLGASWLIARHAVRVAAPADVGPVLAELSRQLLGWSLLLLPLVALLGAALGRRLARPALALRRELLARARGESPAQAPVRPLLAELRGIATAAERLESELTRRIRSEEEQRTLLAVLVDSVSEGLLRIDAGGRIVFANPECRSLLELLPSALGQFYSAVVRSKELRAIIHRVLAGERVSGAELGFGERRVMVSGQPIATERGQPGAGAVLALADLTALRRLEGVRRDFVANVSHELKTPLTSIRGYAETLLQDEDVPPEIRSQFLHVIQKNAARLQQIVDDLLDLSRIESGGWRPDLQPINAAELVRDVWLSCRERADSRHIRFESPDYCVPVMADPGALRQVLANLFDNAIRYTPEGGLIQVRARSIPAPPADGATADDARALWQIEVRDTGSGIPSDCLPRIFERFYRVDPARSRADGGTGLGLSIVKHLVESMDGEVSAQSELGKGTTLRFTLWGHS